MLDTLRTEGPSSQAQLARTLNVSAATVNAIVRDLKKHGTVEIRPINGREGVVTLVTGSGTYVTIEIADHSIRGAAYAFSHQERVEKRIDGDSTIEAALELISDLAEAVGTTAHAIDGLAVAVQAPIERATGAIAPWCNSRLPAWAGVDISAAFRRALDVPVLVDNDANFAALAEWTWGAGRGAEDLLYVRASEGVGGGVVINGSIYQGGSGMAGDLGHIAVDPGGDVCYCGSRGCLTTLISERAIVSAVRTSPGIKRTLTEVIAAARAGDAACQRVLAEAGAYLGRALANAAKILGPSLIAVGGELGEAGPIVFDALLSSVELSSLRSSENATRFVVGEIDESASLQGALAALLTELGKGVSEIEPWMAAA
ncbi:ROK family transcriptional regulator [Leifsonia shinshuensis]|uniref:Putative NBD/HSP70 family sugar kinase n=1 Tax=Leifsonia shinshuensis TaxID=150026 RepID=A0A853CYE1_9MICO|nr:ROK family transcriptional regulator [Leifsonia shinshuensis]NYJ25607.1 putative NBD/HSP70 family sugar kinase [Leifsonia shinshuensis]